MTDLHPLGSREIDEVEGAAAGLRGHCVGPGDPALQ